MLEKNRAYLYLLLTVAIFIAFIFYYQVVHEDKKELLHSKFQEYSHLMKKQIAELISEKQKATVAIGVSLVNDSSLIKDIETHSISKDYYNNLIEALVS